MAASEEFKDQVEIEFEQIVFWITEIEIKTRSAFKDEKHLLQFG